MCTGARDMKENWQKIKGAVETFGNQKMAATFKTSYIEVL